MAPRSFHGNASGQSLVQTLIAVAIMGILAVGMMSIMNYQNTAINGATQKLAAMDLQQLLTASLADGSVCKYVLNNPNVLTFNTTQPLPQSIVLTNPAPNTAALYTSLSPNPAPAPAPPYIPDPIAAQVGQAASPLTPTLIVNKIELVINSGALGNYLGTWTLSFDSSKLVRPLRPVTVQTALNVNESTPTAAFITGCQQPSPGGSITQRRDVTAQRVSGGIYRNTTGKVLYVSYCFMACAMCGVQADFYSDANPNPTTFAGSEYGWGWGTSVTFIVFPGDYYSAVCRSGCSSGNPTFWIEWF